MFCLFIHPLTMRCKGKQLYIDFLIRFSSLCAYYGSIPFSVEEILLSMPHVDPTAIEYPHQLLMRETSSIPSPTHSHNQYSQWWMRSNDKVNILVRLLEQKQASSQPTNSNKNVHVHFCFKMFMPLTTKTPLLTISQTWWLNPWYLKWTKE